MSKRDTDKTDKAPGGPLERAAPIIVVMLVVAVVAPWLLNAYWLKTFTSVACLTLVSASVALLFGQLGMVSLCQFALSGAGGWVTLRIVHGFGLPFELALLAGGVVAALFGLLTGLPALRMRGLYLALVSLMLAAAFQVVINVTGFPDGGPGWLGKVVNGERSMIGRPWLARSDEAYFRYTILFVAMGLVLIEWHRASLPGRAWALIRKGEAAAMAAGVHVVTYKAWAFTVAGFLAGIAGGLLAGSNGQLDNTGFPASQSILLFALTVVGGAYNWIGAVFAGLLIRALPALLNDHGVDGNLANVFFGFALLVSLIQGRKGLAGQLADFYKFVRVSRIVEGAATWTLSAAVVASIASGFGLMGFWGAFFIALIAILFRIAIPGVCWMLLGFFNAQDEAERIEARASGKVVELMRKVGVTPDHRFLKRFLNWTGIGLFIAWVAWGVFGVGFPVAFGVVWGAMALKIALDLVKYPHVLPLRQRIDSRFPKPFAGYN
jgi:branched-chain amino acid transport system permease protein